LLEHGDDGIWDYLEIYYHHIFEDIPVEICG